MGECENEAQKALAGKVFTSESLRTQLEAQRRELVRSCMVSKGFKFNVAKFETDRSAVPEGSVLNSVCEPVVESVAQREPLGELYRQLCLGGMPFPRRAFPLGLDLA